VTDSLKSIRDSFSSVPDRITNSLESHSEMDERSRLGRSDGYAMGDSETHLHLLSVQSNGGALVRRRVAKMPLPICTRIPST
jgi:hypothetical protein